MGDAERSERDSKALRDLGRSLGLASVALVGALPLAVGPAGRVSDPLLLLVWLALCAAPCGAALVKVDVHGMGGARSYPEYIMNMARTLAGALS